MMGLRGRVIRAAHRRLVLDLRATRTLERAVPVQGLFNFQCHRNAVQWVRDRGSENLEVVEVVYVEDGDPVLHYCVAEVGTGRLLEVTLGWYAERLEYYRIRTIPAEDHSAILSEFDRALKHWLHRYVGWFGRRVLGIDRIT